MPTSRFNLSYGKKIMQDDKKLNFYNLKEGSILEFDYFYEMSPDRK